MNIESLKSETYGKWPGIYSNLGIEVGKGEHRPCPVCGGKDRFRFDDKNGTGEYICGQCGSGDGFSLIMKALNKDLPWVINTVSDMVGVIKSEPVDTSSKPDPRLLLNKVWKSSTQLTGSDPVSKYLHSRGLNLRPNDVRFCPKCYESQTKKEMFAMIAMVRDPSGKPVSLHRTYLSEDFKKADIESPKKLMTPSGEMKGSAIRLFNPGELFFDKETLGIAEGIETAIDCAQQFKVATWACISAPIMLNFIPPKEYRKIIVFGDNDQNYTGQKVAYTLANYLYLKDFIVDVKIPEQVGDWNDCISASMKDSIR